MSLNKMGHGAALYLSSWLLYQDWKRYGQSQADVSPFHMERMDEPHNEKGLVVDS